MKKIIYSSYTKFLALVLLIISIVVGTLVVTNGVTKFYDEKIIIYDFENDFKDSQYFSYLLDSPEHAVLSAFYISDNEKSSGLTAEQRIEQELNNLYNTDRVNYYVKWNESVFTNCGATSENELLDDEFYRFITRDKNGVINWNSSNQSFYESILLDEISEYDKTSTFTVCTSIKESFANEAKSIWTRQAAVVRETLSTAIVYVLIALLMLIYLFCVCGKNENGEHKSMWIDNLWTEIHLAIIGAVSVAAVLICAVVIDEYSTGNFPYYLLKMVIGLSVAIGGTVVFTSLLSVVRNLKQKRFFGRSIILHIIKWLFIIAVKILKWLYKKASEFKNAISKMLSKKTGIVLICLLLVYTALIGVFGIFTIESPIWLMLGIILFGFASFVIAYRIKDLDEIKKGVNNVRNGNVAYKIGQLKMGDLRLLATDINDIAKGLDESVSARVKAERLKTELITNVSHDLKTPITSIINYTELLSQIDDLPEEARDFISVISKKSQRLKNLTQDLFDISKVQSGNEDVVFERLDVSLLINQSLGEHDNEIQKSELPFCVNTPKDLYINADGRKMSRVIGNLINNILKYSMKNTRVFITASESDSDVVIEFKNIASYPMNFSSDEIVGRFVRGDESRTAEGNGLGLAIAKSYTEICDGEFEVIVDGDMFKTILKFRKYD